MNGRVLSLIILLGVFALPTCVRAQGQINPRIPPPPPPDTTAPTVSNSPGGQPTSPAPSLPPDIPLQAPAPPPDLPATVQIPAGTRLGVVLDTPLSTRIAKQGQSIRFHTEDSLRLHDLLEIPADTEIVGTVIEAKKPGSFGKPGVLRVRLDSIHLAKGADKTIIARLDSPDMRGNGRLTSDSRRSTDLASLALYTLEGTLIGAQIHGGKGAGIGAGAGALAAILIAMSHKGADLYLEPGMPFTVIIDQAVEMDGKQVYDAQQAYAAAHPAGSNSSSGEGGRGAESSSETSRPKLKRRPHIP